METMPLLRPMPKDALLRRPCPPPPKKEEPAPEPVYAAPVEDDDEEYADLEDAVPTELMPSPVCVPLQMPIVPAKKRRGWIAVLIVAVILAAGFALWKLDVFEADPIRAFMQKMVDKLK